MAFDQDALVASPLWLLDDHRCKLKHAGTGWIDCHFDPVQAGAAKGLQACKVVQHVRWVIIIMLLLPGAARATTASPRATASALCRNWFEVMTHLDDSLKATNVGSGCVKPVTARAGLSLMRQIGL